MNRIAIFFKQAVSPEGSSVKEFLWQHIMYYSVYIYIYVIAQINCMQEY